jgi:hypothetical protein
MKFLEKEYTNKTEILAIPDHYVAIPVMVSDTGVSANADGRKIVPAGTIVGGETKSTLANLNEPVVKKNTLPSPSTVTLNPTGDNNNITLTAKTPGEDGDDISITLADPSGNSQALAVNVTGTDIVVSLATGAGGAITSTAQSVIDAINADTDAKELVIASLPTGNDGTGVVTAITKTQLDNGSDGLGADAEGILLNDVDVTYGDAPGAMLVHAFVKTGALPEVPSAASIAALKMIQFMK